MPDQAVFSTSAIPPAGGGPDWLVAIMEHAGPDAQPAGLDAGMASVSFMDLLTALNARPSGADPGVAMRLYLAWIRANPAAQAHLFAAWFNLGVEASRAGDRPAAARAYQAALALKPDFYAAAINLGLLQEAGGANEAALATWTQALQTDEARVALLNQRARLLEQLGRLDEAEAVLRTSLGTDPAQPDAIQHWVHLRQRMCRWPVLAGEAMGLPRAELMADCGPLAALSLTDRVAAQTAIAARWLARKTTAVGPRLSPAAGYRHDRIRLGYLSSDFGRHAMGYLIAELFERHDRGRFEVYGYCIGAEDGSDIRARILAGFDRFASLRDLSDEAAARAIAADEIDILVDLNGLTRGARPQILRWRPAPIQATYLGFIGPMPLPELDYMFCDDIVVPPAIAPAYRPAPLPIARIYQANDGRRAIGAPTTRAANGLPDDAFVFCCFSNHYKVTQKLFAAWMAILSRVPGSLLWLAADNAWSHQAMRIEAARLGVAPARLVFAERVDPASYIRRLEVADLFLDTFPYNAGTIASDALRMGLPLLTLSGESFASRMAARLLGAIGATGGITESISAYIEAAVAFGTQPETYARFKAQFTESAWRGTIGDAAGFTAEFEATLQTLSGRLPDLDPSKPGPVAPDPVAPDPVAIGPVAMGPVELQPGVA